MKIIAYVIMLTWCFYGIPAEKWHAMNNEQKDAALEDIADDALEEMQCKEVEVTAYESGILVHIYARCSEDKYIAMGKGRSEL